MGAPGANSPEDLDVDKAWLKTLLAERVSENDVIKDGL
jgi:hypothetical protein